MNEIPFDVIPDSLKPGENSDIEYEDYDDEN